jgi:hypothetical protein
MENLEVKKMKVINKLFCLIAMIALGLSGIFIVKKKNAEVDQFGPIVLGSQLVAESLQQHKPETNAEIRVAFTDAFKERETALWNDLQEKYDINYSMIAQERESMARRCKAQRTILKQKYAEGAQKASDTTVQLVHEIAQLCGLKPQEIHVVAVTMGPKNPACANVDVVSIDEKCLTTLSEHEQRYVIAHELGHIVHQDPLTLELLRGLLSSKVTDKDEVTCVMNNVCRFFEERADVFSMTQGQIYAQGGVDFCKKMDDACGLRTGWTHPKWIERYTMAQSISNLSIA